MARIIHSLNVRWLSFLTGAWTKSESTTRKVIRKARYSADEVNKSVTFIWVRSQTKINTENLEAVSLESMLSREIKGSPVTTVTTNIETSTV